MALLVRPTRLLRSAIGLKPSTLLALHKAMSKGKYRTLWLANCYFAHDSSGFPFPATILRWAICSFFSQSSACHCTRRSATIMHP
jgi:hypothetical protein